MYFPTSLRVHLLHKTSILGRIQTYRYQVWKTRIIDSLKQVDHMFFPNTLGCAPTPLYMRDSIRKRITWAILSRYRSLVYQTAQDKRLPINSYNSIKSKLEHVPLEQVEHVVRYPPVVGVCSRAKDVNVPYHFVGDAIGAKPSPCREIVRGIVL